MSFVGDFFHSIGSLFGAGGQAPQMMMPQMPKAPTPAAPAQTPAARTSASPGASPSFLAAAALPNSTSNAGGKSLLGQ